MRRRHFATVVLAIPLTNALSLANFQQITSILVPTACLNAYNRQIPLCEVEDFQKACSRLCKRALERVGEHVADECYGVIANPNSLLGIVKNGNVIQAVCPDGAITIPKPLPISTQPPLVSLIPPGQQPPPFFTSPSPRLSNIQTTPPLSTLPKSSPPASSPSPTSSFPVPSSTVLPSTTFQISTSTSTTQFQFPSPTTSLNPPPSSTGIFIVPSSNGFSTRPISTGSATATPTASTNNNDRTGGGSPFDISGDASKFHSNWMLCTIIVGAWAFLFFGR